MNKLIIKEIINQQHFLLRSVRLRESSGKLIPLSSDFLFNFPIIYLDKLRKLSSILIVSLAEVSKKSTP
jgi:hypothetical protein